MCITDYIEGDTVKLISYPELRKVYGIRFSRVHLGRLERAGKFPKRVVAGGRSIAWLDNELESWIKAQALRRK